METVTLSTKGQLVIPASVRDALRLKPGNRLGIAVEDGNIVLRPVSTPAWKPWNPAGVHLSTEELCKPVDLSHETRRR
ncbi:MAG: AbrB/MazE/SpoVT family DNA-binding domain-containing protein [Pseudoxanthomonas sp.]